MVLAGTLIVGGCGQKAADSTAATAQVTETSDSAPADKPDGAPGENSDKPGNPLDGAQGSDTYLCAFIKFNTFEAEDAKIESPP